MKTLYLYNKSNGVFVGHVFGDYNTTTSNVGEHEDFTTTSPPDSEHVWRWVDNQWVELPPINNPNTPYDDVSVWNEVAGEWQPDDALIAAKKERDQAAIWERIKATRLDKVTSGVYVPSIDKYVHTDADTAAMYAQIGSSILLGTFEEMNWKAMDNTFFNMTENVFKEIQTEMMRQTQRYHAKAEYLRMMMLEVDDPLRYDYQSNWD